MASAKRERREKWADTQFHPCVSGYAAVEDLGNCCRREVVVQLGADFKQFGDADVAEFRPHAEVGDAESLELSGVVGVAVLLDDPPVDVTEEIVEVRYGGASLGFGGVGCLLYTSPSPRD